MFFRWVTELGIEEEVGMEIEQRKALDGFVDHQLVNRFDRVGA